MVLIFLVLIFFFFQGSFALSFPKRVVYLERPQGEEDPLMVNPLSAMTVSPLLNGKFRNPERVTISLSEMWLVYNCPTKVIAPLVRYQSDLQLKSSLFKRRPFDPSVQSIITLVEGYFSLKSAGMRSSSVVLDGHVGMVLKFKNVKLIHETVMRLTVIWDTP